MTVNEYQCCSPKLVQMLPDHNELVCTMKTLCVQYKYMDNKNCVVSSTSQTINQKPQKNVELRILQCCENTPSIFIQSVKPQRKIFWLRLILCIWKKSGAGWYLLALEWKKNERLGGPLDEIVTVSVHKFSVIMSRCNMTSWLVYKLHFLSLEFKIREISWSSWWNSDRFCTQIQRYDVTS